MISCSHVCNLLCVSRLAGSNFDCLIEIKILSSHRIFQWVLGRRPKVCYCGHAGAQSDCGGTGGFSRGLKVSKSEPLRLSNITVAQLLWNREAFASLLGPAVLHQARKPIPFSSERQLRLITLNMR
jgi:hypothetical protein